MLGEEVLGSRGRRSTSLRPGPGTSVTTAGGPSPAPRSPAQSGSAATGGAEGAWSSSQPVHTNCSQHCVTPTMSQCPPTTSFNRLAPPPAPPPTHQNAVRLVLVEPGLVLWLRDDEAEVKQEHLHLQWPARGGGVPEQQWSLVVELTMSVEVMLQTTGKGLGRSMCNCP